MSIHGNTSKAALWPRDMRPAKRMKSSVGVMALCAVLVVAGCGQREEILEGERFGLREGLRVTEEALAVEGAADAEPIENAGETSGDAGQVLRAFDIPKTVASTAWTHRNGSVQHRIDHPALSATPSLIWSASIGQGDDRRHRITAEPVMANGRIFTVDSRATVMAHGTDGSLLWSRDVTLAMEDPDDASGAGLAISGDVLLVTTGFGELIALDVATGEDIWAQRLDAQMTGAPTVSEGLIYGVTRDNIAWAVELANGRIKWQMPAAPDGTAIVGGSSPAVGGGKTLFPFSSGELVATFPKGGVRLWSASVSGRRLGAAYAGFTDITSDPVIVGDTVFVGNPSGRTMAIDLRTGDRIWTAKEGAVGPVWPASDSVFLISDRANLIRLDATTGETLWTHELPYFTKEKVKRRKAIFAHHGPVMAGGQLWVASNDGLLRGFDPATGNLISSIDLPGGATTSPIVVDNTLYVVSADGKLLAYR